MARRHSLQNQPTSPDPQPSVRESFFNPEDKVRLDTGNPTGRKRSASVTGFFTKLLPSHRPERGGTLRGQGFWEQQQYVPQRPEQRPCLGHKHGSDSIVSSGWNPAISLPRRTQTTQDRRSQRRTPFRVQSQPIGTRVKSTPPHRQRPGERDRQQNTKRIRVFKDIHTKEEVAASVVSQLPPDPGSSTKTTIRRLVTTFDAKREARRLRRSLKESRDFLGVQGINPHTGVMDVLTPTSSSPTDRTMMSAPEPKGYSASMSDFRGAHQRAAKTRDVEEASLERLRQQQEKLDKIQRKKDSIRTFQQRMRWRKDTNQWSSVAEPDLSPIADASTRSRTPRSTSDGAIVPPSIHKILRWEHRVVSTPTELETAASCLHNLPGMATQESSDTVIHTPHPGADHKCSVIAEIPGNAVKHRSPTGARRVSESGQGTGEKSPRSSTSDQMSFRKPATPSKDKRKLPQLKIAIPRHTEQQPSPGPLIYEDSFLGPGTEARGLRYHHTRNQAILSPSTPMEVGHDGTRPIDEPSELDMSPIGPPPDVAVRDFAKKRSPGGFADHQDGACPPSQSQIPSIKERKGTQTTTAAPSQTNQEVPHLQRTLLFPHRRGPNPKYTTLLTTPEVEDQPANLIDIGLSMMQESPASPTSGWAQQLMEDLGCLGQETMNLPLTQGTNMWCSPPTAAAKTMAVVFGPKETSEETTTRERPTSAYIPTTTITGYDPRLLMHTRGSHRKRHFDEPVESAAWKEGRVIRVSAMEAATKLQLEQIESARNNDTTAERRVTQVSTTELINTETKPKIELEAATDQPPQKTAVSTSVQQPTHPSIDLLASPPGLPPNVWPSLDIPAPHLQQHRRPSRVKPQQTEVASVMVPYRQEPGVASGTISPHEAQPIMDMPKGGGVSVPEKTTLRCGQDPEPIIPTTSAPQLKATRERCERLCRRVSRRHHQELNKEATTTLAIGPAVADNKPTSPATNVMTTIVPYKTAVTTASPTYASTYQVSLPKYRFMPTPPASCPTAARSTPITVKNNQPPQVREPATEAARTALVGTQYNAATARIVHVVSGKRNGKMATTSTSTAVAWGRPVSSSPDREMDLPDRGRGDIDSHSSNTRQKAGGRSDIAKVKVPSVVKRMTLKDLPARKTEPVTVHNVVVRGMVAYWNLVAPVFDAGSPISKRFSAGRSTWGDCVVYLLTLFFVLVASLAVVWGVRVVLMVAGLGRVVVRCCLVLVGF